MPKAKRSAKAEIKTTQLPKKKLRRPDLARAVPGAAPDAPMLFAGMPGPGRPKGLVNKATTTAKEAISRFVDNNTAKFEEWLEEVKRDDGALAAMRVVVDLIEFAVPKLARVEVRGEMRNTVVLEDSRREELLNFLLKRAGVAQIATQDDADKSIN